MGRSVSLVLVGDLVNCMVGDLVSCMVNRFLVGDSVSCIYVVSYFVSCIYVVSYFSGVAVCFLFLVVSYFSRGGGGVAACFLSV